MEDIIIKVNNVTKKFDKNIVLDNVSLEIPKGKAVTFIGHNGAGKSTLLKIIAKLISINNGNVSYNRDINISYIPEHFPKLNISAEEYLVMMGKIAGMSEKEAKNRTLELTDMFFMTSMKDTKMFNLSKGTLQKVGVIQALLVEPQVLLLDEPLSGQDIDSQNVFIKEINRLKKERGTTVIMSCHEKFLLNSITDIVYEIDGGHIRKGKINVGRLAEYDSLTFDISRVDNKKFKEILSGFEKETLNIIDVDKNGQVKKVALESSRSNELIKEILVAGGTLKEMYHENI